MSQYMTSDQLIESIKRRAQLPTSEATFTDSDFLSFADEEMAMSIMPSIVRLHENYFLYTEEVELEANKTRYTIPYRSMGNRLKDLALQDVSGNIIQMTMIPIEHLPDYNSGNFYTNPVYYVLNNQIVLYPENTPITSGSLLFTYYLRPNSLVKLAKVGVISDVNRTTGVVTLSSLPSEFSLTSKYDFYTSESPHPTYRFDLSITNFNANTKELTFDLSDIPDQIKAGDHLSLACQCAIPQIPSDMHVMLAQKVAARCLEALGDTEGLQNANTKLAEMELNTGTIIDNRVASSPKKWVNRSSFLRRSSLRHRFSR